MRPKTLILLVLALGCGLVASIGISQVLNRNQESGPPDETAPVWVAMAEIKSGDVLNPQNLKLEQWPKEKIPPGALGRLEQVQGKHTRVTIYQGEPVLEKKLRASGTSVGDSIPPGFRAYTVQGDSCNSHGGLLHPGDRVDVMVFVSKNSGGIETGTKTILQDIKVFAVNDQTSPNDEKGGDSIVAKTVTLLMTPSQAERATLAAEIGKIRLVIRAPDDKSSPPDAGITLSDLFTTEKTNRDDEEARDRQANGKPKSPSLAAALNAMSQMAAPAGNQPPAVPDRFNIQIIKGTEITETEFRAKPSDGSHWEIGSVNPIPTSPNGASAPASPSDETPKSDNKVQTGDKDKNGSKPDQKNEGTGSGSHA